MAKIIQQGDPEKYKYVPEGFVGTCGKCGCSIVTESTDLNVGQDADYQIKCPTPLCGSLIKVHANYSSYTPYRSPENACPQCGELLINYVPGTSRICGKCQIRNGEEFDRRYPESQSYNDWG